MISNVLLINQKGEVVISRIYREGASQKTIDTFRNQVCGVSCASGGADARSRARRPGDLCTGGAWVARGGQGMREVLRVFALRAPPPPGSRIFLPFSANNWQTKT